MIPAEGKEFPLRHTVQTGYGVHVSLLETKVNHSKREAKDSPVFSVKV